MPRAGKRLGLAEARILGKRAYDGADVLEMPRTRASDGILEIAGLEQDVHEGATLEVLTVEPLVEEVEDREQLLLGRRAATPRLRLDPPLRPPLLAPLEKRERQIVLRGEVPVEGRLGDRGAVDQLVDADGADAALREELVRALEDALARSEFRSRFHNGHRVAT